MEIFRTIAKISLFYCWGILIWATLYILYICGLICASNIAITCHLLPDELRSSDR